MRVGLAAAAAGPTLAALLLFRHHEAVAVKTYNLALVWAVSTGCSAVW